MKHFELTVNEITGERKRLETRLLVRNQTGTVYGVTYKWRSDNSDADLLPGALDEDIPIITASGARASNAGVIPAAANVWPAITPRPTMSWE